MRPKERRNRRNGSSGLCHCSRQPPLSLPSPLVPSLFMFIARRCYHATEYDVVWCVYVSVSWRLRESVDLGSVCSLVAPNDATRPDPTPHATTRHDTTRHGAMQSMRHWSCFARMHQRTHGRANRAQHPTTKRANRRNTPFDSMSGRVHHCLTHTRVSVIVRMAPLSSHQRHTQSDTNHSAHQPPPSAPYAHLHCTSTRWSASGRVPGTRRGWCLHWQHAHTNDDID